MIGKRSSRRSGAWLCLALSAAFSILTLSAAPQDRPGRVVLVSFDGAADWIVDRLIAGGKAPAFERLAREGARAEAMVSVLPTLTAPAHATLWTGVSPRAHTVVGNTVLRLPRSAHSLLDRVSGFDHPTVIEPIWAAAARSGRRSLVLQAAATQPSPELAEHVTEFDVYSKCSPSELIEGRLSGDPAKPFVLEVEDTPVEIGSAAGGVAIDVRGERSLLRARRGSRFSSPINVAVASRAFRLGLLSHDQVRGTFKLLRGRVCEALTNRPDKLGAFRREAGTIVGETAVEYYLSGRLGTPLADGGTGEAEDLLSEVLEANQEYFDGALQFAAEERWDLLVAYVPSLDAVGHALAGIVDAATMGHRTELADRAWPTIERIFARTVDGYVADIRNRFPDATLVAVSDHGMEGSARTVHVNVALRHAGLLTLDSDGQIALAETLAFHLYGNGGGIFLNTTDRRHGIVGADRRELVKSRVTAALLGIRDPDTGAAPVRAVFDTEIDGSVLGIGGAAGADLYFDLAPGYDLSTALGGDATITAQRGGGSGDHGGAPWHRGLHAIFFAAGPGIRGGHRLGLVRAIDVAPTVASLLGLPPLQAAEGRSLDLSAAQGPGGLKSR